MLIEDVTSRFGKTLSTLKRSMKEINEFLEPNCHLHIDGQWIVTAIGYREYIAFLEQLPFNRYITTADERIKDLSVALCLQDVVNKSEYYRKFNVSPTTLKNDNQALSAFLQANHLTVTAIPKQGSQLDGEHENRFLDLLISSLTYTWRPFDIYDPTLITLVGRLCESLTPLLRSAIHNRSSFFAEIYQFVYSTIVQNKFNLYFDDKKLHQVQTRHTLLYQSVVQATAPIAQHYQTTFSPVHLSTLVLILKKYELQNRVHSEEKKRVIIVTNSSESKVGYFKEVLKSHFHIEIVGYVNINEIRTLEQIPFDLLITFTNKISSYLKYYQWDYIKVNFYLSRDDISLLSQHGLSRAKKKIPAEGFIQEIEGLDRQQLRTLLERQYPDFFI
ncbi:MAG: hypothetical protein ACRDAJ_07785 [Serratia fonticola]